MYFILDLEYIRQTLKLKNELVSLWESFHTVQ